MAVPRRPRACAGAVLAAACVVSSIIPAPLHAQEPGFQYEEGFFDIALPRVGRRIGVTTLVDPSGRVLIPLRPVLEHTGIASTWAPDSALIEWPPGDWRMVLHFGDGRVETGAGTTRLAVGDWVRAGGEVYLGEEALETVLGSEVDIVFADLAIVLAPNPEFPAIRRTDIELRRRFDRGALGGGPIAAGADVPYPARTGGFVTSWGFSFVDAPGEYLGAVRGAAGASLLGGALEGGATLGFGDATATSFDDEFIRWTRGFPIDPWIRQVQVGSIFSEGPAGRRLYGGSVTNAPLTTPRLYGEAVIEPAVPAGWEYEVYQGDFLIGVGSREAPGGIRTPLNYGNTPVRVRLLGPSGQESTQDLVYVVRPEMVPAGELRYGVGAGACADPGCDAYGWADLRYGLFQRFTAGIGVDHLAPDDSAAEWRPYVMATGSPLPNLGGEIQYQPGALLRGSMQLQSSTRGSVTGSYAWLEPRAGEGTAGWSGQVSAAVPTPLFGNRYVTARVMTRGFERDRIDSWQATLATSIRRVFASLEYESGLQARDLFTGRAFASWPRPAGLHIRDLSVSGAMGVSGGGAELFEAGVVARPVTNLTVSASFRTRREVKPLFTLGFSSRFSAGYAQARATAAPGGTSMFLSADGGIAGDPYLGAILLPFESIGRAGIAGIVYEDRNGDGVRAADEPPLPGAVVTVGAQRVTADETGSFHTWLLQPYEAVPVGLDSLSIPFDQVAAVPYFLIRPSPNLFTRIDVAVLRTRELTGVVESPDALPVAGIAVEVLDDGGNVVAETRTFRDGEFYVPRLRPGVYRARIAASSLAVLGARPEPADRLFGVTFDGDEPIRLAPLELRR